MSAVDPGDRPRGTPEQRLPIVASDLRAGRRLLALVASLAFLAALASGTAALVAARSAAWGREIARAATVQLRPVAGRDMEADLGRAAAIARATAGIASARILDRREAESLLEPWLGRGLDLSDLPVPRLVALELDRSGKPDLAGLATRLGAEVAGATLDDHAGSLARLVRAARTVIALALAVALVVLLASAGAIGFAVAGATAAQRDVVEVLHYVGADDAFIARLFARRFARLGLIGGLAGAVAAGLVMAALAWRLDWETGPAEAAAAAASCAIVALAYGGVAALVTSGSVRRFLRATDRG